jgi:hypothetical protein
MGRIRVATSPTLTETENPRPAPGVFFFRGRGYIGRLWNGGARDASPRSRRSYHSRIAEARRTQLDPILHRHRSTAFSPWSPKAATLERPTNWRLTLRQCRLGIRKGHLRRRQRRPRSPDWLSGGRRHRSMRPTEIFSARRVTGTSLKETKHRELEPHSAIFDPVKC